MTSLAHERRRQRWAEYGFTNLLLWLFFYLLVGPFLEHTRFANTILSVFLTLVMVSALAALGESRRTFAFAAGLLGIAVVLLWLQNLQMISPRMDVASLSMACFLLPLVYGFGKHLFKVKKVTGNVICAALCLYLIIGMLWGALFSVLESLAPGSFSGDVLSAASSAQEMSHHLKYFSYVTLSTLGYGDITPATRGAEALCQTEAIFGQFLTVVLVARLVGIQVAQESTTDNDGS